MAAIGRNATGGPPIFSTSGPLVFCHWCFATDGPPAFCHYYATGILPPVSHWWATDIYHCLAIMGKRKGTQSWDKQDPFICNN